jgi:putative transposase
LARYIIERHAATQYRACRLVKISRSVFSYKAEPNNDDEIAKNLKLLAAKHNRYGFKKLFYMIRKQGYKWNHKRVYRIYCELKLNLKRKPKKRLPSREKITLHQPVQLNDTWSLDYMSDALVDGRKFRTLNVIDDSNREVLVIHARSSMPASQVTLLLDQIGQEKGYPKKIRMDNGPENISKLMKKWAALRNIEITYIQPGKPAQNGYVERFNRTYREEILDMYLFTNIQEVQTITDRWITQYNNQRPHEALGNLAPCEFLNREKFSTFELY